MNETLTGQEPESVTILRCAQTWPGMRKLYTLDAGVITKHERGKAKHFAAETVRVSGLGEFHALLCRVEQDPRALIVRGAILPSANRAWMKRRTNGAEKTLFEVPRSWVMLDVDGIPLPPHLSTLNDPEGVARFALAYLAGHLPEIARAGAVVQFSASAGLQELAETDPRWRGVTRHGVSAHCYFWLDRPLGREELERWVSGAKAAGANIDPAVLRPGQEHFTAAPLFGAGLYDPLAGRRTLLIPGDNLSPVVPAVAVPQRGSEAGSNAASGLGYKSYLDQIGGAEGFHAPIKRAIGSYIRRNWPSPDLQRLKGDLRERILTADPGDRPAEEIARYASDPFLDDKIKWTMEEQGRPPAVEHVAPTHPDRGVPVAEARNQVTEFFTGVMKECTIHESFESLLDQCDKNRTFEVEKSALRTSFPVMALRADWGVGKSTEAARFCSRFIPELRVNKDKRAVAFAVPTIENADQVADTFRRFGLVAKVIRGRAQKDPDQDGKDMCHDLKSVRDALALGANVKTSCCVGKNDKNEVVECPLKAQCGFFKQFDEPQVDVWIISHNYIFTGLKEIGKIALLIIDEEFTSAAWWEDKTGLTIDEIETSDDANLTDELRDLRAMLGSALRMHDTQGGARREHLAAVGLSTEMCAKAGHMEWKLKQDVTLYPGMPDDKRKLASQAAKQARFVAKRAGIWRAAQHLLEQDATAVSGRLMLFDKPTDHGRTRVVLAHGVKEPAKQFKVPTVIMDATLPDTTILQAIYPNVKRCAEISVTTPHVTVRQVVGAPVSGNKLGFGKGPLGNTNCQNVYRRIQAVYNEFGRQPMLVGCREELAKWLRKQDLPDNIAIEHFNSGGAKGSNKYGHVRVILSIYGTLVEPMVAEKEAGILSGLEPQRAEMKPNGSSWYDRATGGVRLPDGSGTAVDVYRHPDALAEAIRWQKYEANILQVCGRGRGVNRDDVRPLHIEIMADVVLPLTVNEVVPWSTLLLGKRSVMSIAGVILENAADMSRAFPTVWKDTKAAQNYKIRNGAMTSSFALLKGSPKGNEEVLPDGWIMFEYRRDARGAKIAYGIVNQGICPEPRLWLEERLGPLAHFEIDEPPVVIDEGAERERFPVATVAREPDRNRDAPTVIAGRNPPVVDGPSPPPPMVAKGGSNPYRRAPPS